MAIIDNRRRNFDRNVECSSPEFVCNTGLISAFKKPRAKKRVNLHSRVHNGTSDFVYAVYPGTSRRSHMYCISGSPVFLCDPCGENVFWIPVWERH